MRPLLAGHDSEASFFTNIRPIQNAGIRWTPRMTESGSTNPKASARLYSCRSTIYSSEAINMLGRIAKQFHWPAYYGLVQKYVRSATTCTCARAGRKPSFFDGGSDPGNGLLSLLTTRRWKARRTRPRSNPHPSFRLQTSKKCPTP